MSSGANFFLKKNLGEDFLQSLEKFELWKPGTKTVVDHEEIKTALKIVPRTMMSFLIRELSPMKVGEHKDIQLDITNHIKELGPDMLHIDKHERDVYSGEIVSENKKVAEFKYRSLPGVGLVIMSTFELYDMEELDRKPAKPINDGMESKVQALIDERMALHAMVNRAVDKKLSEKDSIQQLIDARTKEHKNKIVEAAMMVTPTSDNCPIAAVINGDIAKAQEEPKKTKAKGSPLKQFLNDRATKLKKNEYQVKMVKGEQINCPDCGHGIFDGDVFSSCICFGDCGKIFIKKTEDGIKVRFGKDWEIDNIEMLLEVLRRKRG